MKEKIFYEIRDMDDYNSNKEYYRTFPFEIRTKNEIFKKINLFDKDIKNESIQKEEKDGRGN